MYIFLDLYVSKSYNASIYGELGYYTLSNIIDAIINLVNNPVTDVELTKLANNRANMIGDALEEFVKDLFANTF